ncbi:MAG: hypothetical protein WBB76_08985 [Gaiellaceae bacterium]
MLFGRKLETELEVVAYAPERRLKLHSIGGPVDLVIDHVLEEIDGMTQLHVTASANPGGLLRLAGPAIAGAARQELQGDFDRLKKILEGAAEE